MSNGMYLTNVLLIKPSY